jgi:hypothetical protein
MGVCKDGKNFVCVYKVGEKDDQLKQRCEEQDLLEDFSPGDYYKHDHYLVSCDCCPRAFDFGGTIGVKNFKERKTSKSVKDDAFEDACPIMPSASPSNLPTPGPTAWPSAAPSLSSAPTLQTCPADSGEDEEKVCKEADENFVCVYKVGDDELKQKCEQKGVIESRFAPGDYYKEDHYLVACDCCPESFDFGGEMGVKHFTERKTGKSIKGDAVFEVACPAPVMV